jgi:hypothetical protein
MITSCTLIKVLMYVRCFALCVPAVLGVVSHLVAHVLTEPQPLWTDSNSNQELMDTTNVVPQCLVSDKPLGRLRKEENLITTFHDNIITIALSAKDVC